MGVLRGADSGQGREGEGLAGEERGGSGREQGVEVGGEDLNHRTRRELGKA